MVKGERVHRWLLSANSNILSMRFLTSCRQFLKQYEGVGRIPPSAETRQANNTLQPTDDRTGLLSHCWNILSELYSTISLRSLLQIGWTEISIIKAKKPWINVLDIVCGHVCMKCVKRFVLPVQIIDNICMPKTKIESRSYYEDSWQGESLQGRYNKSLRRNEKSDSQSQ